MLQGIKAHFEKHYRVFFADEAIVAAVELSELYMPGVPLPEKAINLIDEAGAQLGPLEPGSKMSAQITVGEQEIVRAISLETGVSEADIENRRNLPGAA